MEETILLSRQLKLFRDIDLLIKETRRRYPLYSAILYGHSIDGNLTLSYTLNYA